MTKFKSDYVTLINNRIKLCSNSYEVNYTFLLLATDEWYRVKPEHKWRQHNVQTCYQGQRFRERHESYFLGIISVKPHTNHSEK